ncbi:acyl-CoA dehydrogenase [Halosimplex amylolyticum]|uniref:acyl-CoA dehydrogenase n=1 Tax=Halosimplex amylolyticum TaxID=3396616 RepID=UPI003F57C703
MNNFKSGSGNLDFGRNDDDESDEDESTADEPDSRNEQATTESSSRNHEASDSASRESVRPDRSSGEQTSEQEFQNESTVTSTTTEKYPYFVRRNNVGDERDTRLEIHVRNRVADQEAEFRNELAQRLDTSEVSKTDAREFALLAAFQHPERVAELMREEGFDALD